MFKRVRKWLHKLWDGPTLNAPTPTKSVVPMNWGASSISQAERHHSDEMATRQAEFNLQKQALQYTLRITWRTMLVALFAAFIALLIGLYGILAKPSTRVVIQKIVVTQNK